MSKKTLAAGEHTAVTKLCNSWVSASPGQKVDIKLQNLSYIS